MITAAENAIKNHPNLEKVVIVEHATRFDPTQVDPLGLKPELAKFANDTLKHLRFASSFKNKVEISSHTLGIIIRAIPR